MGVCVLRALPIRRVLLALQTYLCVCVMLDTREWFQATELTACHAHQTRMSQAECVSHVEWGQ